jgi:methylase of polypeptide subunit release factors
LISIYAAQKGAIVTATDINPVAIEYLRENTRANHVHIDILRSDLFDEIPVRVFDIVAINPPYYKKDLSHTQTMHGIAAVTANILKNYFLNSEIISTPKQKY